MSTPANRSLESVAKDRWLCATYRVASDAATIEARAQAIAIEQSVEMPVEAITDRHVLEEIVGRVADINPDGLGHFRVRIELSVATTGFEASQLMNMAFGNTSLHADVELVDLEMPQLLLEAFSGPRYGIEGLRDVTGVRGRALTATALKPQGLVVESLAHLASKFARAGIDIIKDDHGLANQEYSPFEKRVPAVQQAVDAANRETGGCTIYAPTISGSPREMAYQTRLARDAGVKSLLAAPMLLGLAAFRELARDSAGMPILAHPAFAGAQRIAAPLLIGKLFRLFGADAVIFPNHGGRFSWSPEMCRGLANEARGPLGTMLPAFPVPAGGMTPERVPEMLSFYGPDVILLIGGGLLLAGNDLHDATRAFVDAVK